MKRYGFIGAALLGLAGLAWLCTSGGRPTVFPMVSQQNRKFSPDGLTIMRGTIVHIRNDDNVTHHVFIDAPDMKFDSGEQPVGTMVNVPFNGRGTFDVQCAIHPTMHIAVKVE